MLLYYIEVYRDITSPHHHPTPSMNMFQRSLSSSYRSLSLYNRCLQHPPPPSPIIFSPFHSTSSVLKKKRNKRRRDNPITLNPPIGTQNGYTPPVSEAKKKLGEGLFKYAPSSGPLKTTPMKEVGHERSHSQLSSSSSSPPPKPPRVTFPPPPPPSSTASVGRQKRQLRFNNQIESELTAILSANKFKR